MTYYESAEGLVITKARAEGQLFDINGNQVGTFKLTGPPPFTLKNPKGSSGRPEWD